MQEVETYVSLRQYTFEKFIMARPIVEMYLVAEQCPGARVSKRWW